MTSKRRDVVRFRSAGIIGDETLACLSRSARDFVLQDIAKVKGNAVKAAVAVADLDEKSFAQPLLIEEERSKDLIVSSRNQKTSPRRRRGLELKKSE